MSLNHARNKLQPNGKKAIMIGYLREKVGYRLFDIERYTIIEERNVIFDESIKARYKGYLLNKRKLYNNDDEDWNIDDVLKILNNDNKIMDDNIIGDSNPDEEVQGEERELGPDHDLNQDENSSQNEGRHRGRPKGTTYEENQDERRKQEILKDREERLRGEEIRRSERLEKFHHARVAGDIKIPSKYTEACDDENWQEAMENELNSLQKHNVWEIVERQKNIKTVKSKWVFHIKRNNKNESDIRLDLCGWIQPD